MIVRTCKTCRQRFTIDDRKIAWCEAHDYHLPRHCESCRNQKRANDQRREAFKRKLRRFKGDAS